MPEFIFETSWEVCNKVGGIYTVLSTKALTAKKNFADNIIYVGPKFETNPNPIDFVPCNEFSDWKKSVFQQQKIVVDIGRWKIPGEPLVILVDFSPLIVEKNDIYGRMWEAFGVDSIKGSGDYHEASIFGFAAGLVIESFCRYFGKNRADCVAHFHEWMTSFGLFYLKKYSPEIKTVFTTHATTAGRSIAGNSKPLYDSLLTYNSDQIAASLGIEAKHSAEKTAAHLADCFTTVSKITAKECAVLLEKIPDVVTPNGFEDNFVPSQNVFEKKKNIAKKLLKTIAEKTLGYEIEDKDYLFVGISGRYEYKNKGIDVFIDAMSELNNIRTKHPILAFIIVPAWVKSNEYGFSKFSSAALVNQEEDLTLNYIRQRGFANNAESNVKIIFIPTYLNGTDGKINIPYYDVLMGLDLTIFPSYYEPWGYTPMESAAFGIPTITTSLAGFGMWVADSSKPIENGVAVVQRNDHNYFEVVEEVKNQVIDLMNRDSKKRKEIAQNAKNIAKNGLWSKFYQYYLKAYNIALSK